jgi:nitronate monooxygenase
MTSSLPTLLGIELPIIQAPMAGSQGSALAIAVSRVGGLGSLPCAMLGVDAIRTEVAAIRAGIGDKPFNLNFFCHQSPAPDTGREAQWRQALAPYYNEYGIDPASITAGSGRNPFTTEAASLVAELRPAVVSFHFGLPAPELLAAVRATGARVLSSATTLAEGLWLQEHGADAVIAQGLEAGGHRGHFLSDELTLQLGTFSLVPQLARALRVPVIAAGGIGNASGVAAAMALGAAGVQVGSVYLLCPEAGTSAIHRAALASDAARHTALTNLFSGRPARGIVNRLMRELGPLADVAPAFPLAGGALAPLRARAEAAGSGDFSPLWAGQSAFGARAMPAAELTRELARGLG